MATDELIHVHEHLLLWQVRGHADYVLDGVERRVAAGHAVWVPARVVHRISVHANSVVLRLFFNVDEAATTLTSSEVIAVDRDLRTLMLAYSQSGDSLLQKPLNLTRQILSLIEEQPMLAAALPMPSADPALVVAESLRFNPGDDRSGAELAELARASERTLERAFLAETGMTMRQWRIRNRMEAAGVLLRTETNLSAVAHRVGYTNTSAFGRAFKTHFALTPTEYIARYRSER